MKDFFSELDRMCIPLLALWSKEVDLRKKSLETSNIMSSFELNKCFDEEQLLKNVLKKGINGHYPAGTFADFNCLLGENSFFRMELYFWNHLDTGLHSHPFYGSFQCLKGEVVVQDYSFTASEILKGSREIALGKLNLSETKRVKEGDVYSIYSGPDHIHKSLHVGPTVNFCVRSLTDPSIPNYNFLYPDFRIEKKSFTFEEEKRLELFNYLVETHAQSELIAGTLDLFDLPGIISIYLSGSKFLARFMSVESARVLKDECKKRILEDKIFCQILNSENDNQIFISKLNFAYK
jgi:quercetin dioxygenase-like cupin family protein